MKTILLLFCLVAGILSIALNGMTGEQMKNFLNEKQNYFKAGDAFFSEEELKARVMKKEFMNHDALNIPFKQEGIIEATIPTTFDARTHWKDCASIGSIRQQSACGSCWAFAAAELITDRACIAHGSSQPILSPEDILACCSTYSSSCGNCDGGYPATALDFWHAKGVVTGGDYNSNYGCKPYTISPTNSKPSTPSCSSSCRSGYTTSYSSDKHFGSSGSYRIAAKNVAAIQTEIMNHGPVLNCFDLYADFNNYKSGVYVHSTGSYVGGHCVKIFGWGTENGTPYWLAANSWGTGWGEKGFFKIIRGVNECNFEEWIYAATPK